MFSFLRALTVAATAGLSVVVPALPTTSVTTCNKEIAVGVLLTQTLQSNPPLLINVLTIDSGRLQTHVGVRVAMDSLTASSGNIRAGRENVAAFVNRTGAAAAVNGDYFPFTGDPLGLGISDGELYSEPYQDAAAGFGRAAIGWLPSGRVIVGIPAMQARLIAPNGFTLPVTGIDRLTSTTNPLDVCLITPRFGPTSGARGLGTELIFTLARPLPVQAGRQIAATLVGATSGAATAADVPAGGFVVELPAGSTLAGPAQSNFRVGDKSTLAIDLVDATPPRIGALGGSWNRVRQAIGGGPILLRDGHVIVDDAAEGLGGAFSTAPHARTAVGQRRDGRIVVVTVDSGSSLSGGVSLAQLAGMMQSLGVQDALNLDGGGSTTMAVSNGITVDYPYGSAAERPVADMLAVFAPELPNAAEPSAAHGTSDAIAGIPASPVIGGQYLLSVVGADERAVDGVLWNGPVGGCGFVSQDGVLHITGAGRGVVMARFDEQQFEQTIEVASPLPIQLPSHLGGEPLPAAPQPAIHSRQSGESQPSAANQSAHAAQPHRAGL